MHKTSCNVKRTQHSKTQTQHAQQRCVPRRSITPPPPLGIDDTPPPEHDNSHTSVQTPPPYAPPNRSMTLLPLIPVPPPPNSPARPAAPPVLGAVLTPVRAWSQIRSQTTYTRDHSHATHRRHPTGRPYRADSCQRLPTLALQAQAPVRCWCRCQQARCLRSPPPLPSRRR
jgi:hypothetical protein